MESQEENWFRVSNTFDKTSPFHDILKSIEHDTRS